jgi:hypothetical protein
VQLVHDYTPQQVVSAHAVGKLKLPRQICAKLPSTEADTYIGMLPNILPEIDTLYVDSVNWQCLSVMPFAVLFTTGPCPVLHRLRVESDSATTDPTNTDESCPVWHRLRDV